MFKSENFQSLSAFCREFCISDYDNQAPWDKSTKHKKYSPLSQNFNPISTGGGGSVFHPPICFLPVTFLCLNQFPPNLVTFPKI